MKESELREIENTYRQTYTKESLNYDKTRFGSVYGRIQEDSLYYALNYLLPDKKVDLILDVATGTGVASIYLSKKGEKVVALDLTEAMLAKARAKAEENRIKNISFDVGSAFNLPYDDNSFNIVVSNKFMHLLEHNNKKLVIKEMFRVLTPGGFLFIECKNGFYGLVLRLFKDAKKEGYCLWPHQIKTLTDIKIVKILGSYFPGQKRLPRNRFLDKIIEILGNKTPLKYFCDRLYILYQKI